MIKDYFKFFVKKLHIIIPIGVLYALYAIFFPRIFKGHSACPVKEIFGIPCPGCGMTRAYMSFFKGDILDAFYYHPLFLMIPVILWILIFNERPKINKLYKSKLFWISILLLFLVVYIIRFILIYPYYPMNLHEGLLNKILNRF